MGSLTFVAACMFFDLQNRRVPNDFVVCNGIFLIGNHIRHLLRSGQYETALCTLGILLLVLGAGFFLYAAGAFGGADLKIASVILCVLCGRSRILFIVLSVCIALVHGVAIILWTEEGRQFLKNMVNLVILRNNIQRLHRIPFTCSMTIALFIVILLHSPQGILF